MLRLFAVVVLVLGSGCYRSHRRLEAGTDAGRLDVGVRDGGARDAGAADAGHDAPVPPRRCREIRGGIVRELDGRDGVTTRVTSLEGGEVGVVYVVPSGGSPTEVVYERLDGALERVTGPVSVATDSWTWAEPATVDGGLVVAYGVTAGLPSRLVPIDRNGSPRDAPRPGIVLEHPSILRGSGDTIFWLTYAMRGSNSFELGTFRTDGTPLHTPNMIALGRYGNGFGVASREDGRAHVLGYTSEGPSGVRGVRVNAIDERGELAGERTLSPSGDASIPVLVGDELVLVWRDEGEVHVTTLDPVTLEPSGDERVGTLAGALFAGALDGLLVYGALDGGRFVAHGGGATWEESVSGVFAPSWSATSVPGALVVASHLNLLGGTRPIVLRIECAD